MRLAADMVWNNARTICAPASKSFRITIIATSVLTGTELHGTQLIERKKTIEKAENIEAAAADGMLPRQPCAPIEACLSRINRMRSGCDTDDWPFTSDIESLAKIKHEVPNLFIVM